MTAFVDEFNELDFAVHTEHQSVSHIGRARWATHDKEKFDGLIRQLSEFVLKLNQIIPDSPEVTVNMAKDDLSMASKKINIR